MITNATFVWLVPKAWKKNLQCHAAANIFIIFEEEVKKDISTLNILEKELTYQRLLLKNSNKTKKGLPKLKGTTVNLAVDVSDTVKKCTIYWWFDIA